MLALDENETLCAILPNASFRTVPWFTPTPTPASSTGVPVAVAISRLTAGAPRAILASRVAAPVTPVFHSTAAALTAPSVSVPGSTAVPCSRAPVALAPPRPRRCFHAALLLRHDRLYAAWTRGQLGSVTRLVTSVTRKQGPAALKNPYDARRDASGGIVAAPEHQETGEPKRVEFGFARGERLWNAAVRWHRQRERRECVGRDTSGSAGQCVRIRSSPQRRRGRRSATGRVQRLRSCADNPSRQGSVPRELTAQTQA